MKSNQEALRLAPWDVAYERKAVLLLALGFGLVGLDRWIISPIFPLMMRDLHLSYQDLGLISGALAMGWGASALLMGRLSDSLGRRKMLVYALVAFSLLSAVTGLATGLVALVTSRVLMGITEGAYTPACTASASEASRPDRRGRGQGIVFCAFPLLGLGLGPIFATQLLLIVPSWRWVFMVVAVPGIALAWFLNRIVRDRPLMRSSGESASWLSIWKSRNLSLATSAMVCAMSCVFVLGALLPSYLIDWLHLSSSDMGLIMSALGFGGAIGNFLLPAVSDFLGRKPAAIGATVISIGALVLLSHLGRDLPVLYATVMTVAVFCFGLLSLMSGPIATEAVSPTFAASTIGAVSGTAELCGGGVIPIIGGYVASTFGIQHIFYLGEIGLLLALPAVLLLRETAPRLERSPN